MQFVSESFEQTENIRNLNGRFTGVEDMEYVFNRNPARVSNRLDFFSCLLCSRILLVTRSCLRSINSQCNTDIYYAFLLFRYFVKFK